MSTIFSAQSYDFTSYVDAQNYIAGQWVSPQNSKTMEVINPRHAKSMANVVLSGAQDVSAAVEAQCQAH